MAATGARRNGTPVKSRRPAKAAAQPKPPAPLTPSQKVADLEHRMARLEDQFRNFVAQQMLKDPAVQARLQQEFVARMAAAEGG